MSSCIFVPAVTYVHCFPWQPLTPRAPTTCGKSTSRNCRNLKKRATSSVTWGTTWLCATVIPTSVLPILTLSWKSSSPWKELSQQWHGCPECAATEICDMCSMLAFLSRRHSKRKEPEQTLPSSSGLLRNGLLLNTPGTVQACAVLLMQTRKKWLQSFLMYIYTCSMNLLLRLTSIIICYHQPSMCAMTLWYFHHVQARFLHIIMRLSCVEYSIKANKDSHQIMVTHEGTGYQNHPIWNTVQDNREEDVWGILILYTKIAFFRFIVVFVHTCTC